MKDEKKVVKNTGKFDIKLNESGTAYSVKVSGFPKKLWELWRKQCIDNFGSVRWVKVWTDHLKAQAYDLIIKSQEIIVEKEIMTEGEENTGEKEDGLGLLNPENE